MSSVLKLHPEPANSDTPKRQPKPVPTRWEGGYVRIDSEGRKVFVIHKQYGGNRYHVSTGCHEPKPALDEWERFKVDPRGYKTKAERLGDKVLLDEALSKRFLDWSLNTQNNTPHWVAQQRRYLAQLAILLAGVDLRGSDLRAFYPAIKLGDWSTVQKRIAVLKRLYSWLRTEDMSIEPSQDPTLGQLEVPPSPSAQAKKSRVIPVGKIPEILASVSTTARDALIVLLATGWHGRELKRFAVDGTIEDHPTDPQLKVLTTPRHKSGVPFRSAVSLEASEAATRLRAHKTLNLWNLRLQLRAACKKAKTPELSYGSIRHTVTTMAVNSGQDIAAVAAALGHKDKRTTQKYYATHSTPAKLKTLF